MPNLSANPNFLANGGLPPSNAIVITTDPTAARASISGYNYDQFRPYAINWSFGVQRSSGRIIRSKPAISGRRACISMCRDQLNRITDVTPSYSLLIALLGQRWLLAPGQLSGAEFDPSGLLQQHLLGAMTNFPASPSNSLWPVSIPQHPSITTLPSHRRNWKYNGLALQLNKRYSRNVACRTAFTWSHALDDSPPRYSARCPDAAAWAGLPGICAPTGVLLLARSRCFRLSTFTPSYDFKRLANCNWMMKNVVANWNFSATCLYQSPAYTTVWSGIDSNLNNDSAGDRAVVNPAGNALLFAVTAIEINKGADRGVGQRNHGGLHQAMNPNARYIQAGLWCVR